MRLEFEDQYAAKEYDKYWRFIDGKGTEDGKPDWRLAFEQTKHEIFCELGEKHPSWTRWEREKKADREARKRTDKAINIYNQSLSKGGS